MSFDRKQDRAGVYFIGAVVAFLLAGFFGYALFESNAPKTPDEVRAAVRQQYLEELKSSETAFVNEYTLLDAETGIVGLPIAQAMEVMAVEWKDSAQGRDLLLKRLEKSGKTPEPIEPAVEGQQ